MRRDSVLAAGLFACLIPAGTFAQDYRKTVTVEVYVPESARLFIEGQETRSKGPMRRFLSPPLRPGKYTYTIKAIIPGPKGPRTVTQRIDVRPGDFESIDLREPGERPITDVEYEPTPQNVVDAVLRLAKVTSKDVVWDLGCGDGRIPVTAAKEYGCKACGFDIDPEHVKDSLANVRKHGVKPLVTIEQRDIFKLDLSKGPTVVTLYLLPRLNAKLLPQLQKLPPGCASFQSRTGWPTSSRTSRSSLTRNWVSSTFICGRRKRSVAIDLSCRQRLVNELSVGSYNPGFTTLGVRSELESVQDLMGRSPPLRAGSAVFFSSIPVIIVSRWKRASTE